jgi:hypothetical protein
MFKTVFFGRVFRCKIKTWNRRSLRAQRNSQIMNTASFVTSATSRYGSQSAASDSTREPAIWLLEFSVLLRALRVQNIFFSARVFGFNVPSERRSFALPSRSSPAGKPFPAGKPESHSRRGGKRFSDWSRFSAGRFSDGVSFGRCQFRTVSACGDGQGAANCPMLGRDRFSRHRGTVPIPMVPTSIAPAANRCQSRPDRPEPHRKLRASTREQTP